MKVGFTGTQTGMTIEQAAVCGDILALLSYEGYKEFHHGDCIGADEEAAAIAKKLLYTIVSHPPTIDLKRAYFKSDSEKPALPYLDRNKNIVDECDFLVAAPQTTHEVLRSGTWSTIRYAQKKKKPIVIIYPTGFITRKGS